MSIYSVETDFPTRRQFKSGYSLAHRFHDTHRQNSHVSSVCHDWRVSWIYSKLSINRHTFHCTPTKFKHPDRIPEIYIENLLIVSNLSRLSNTLFTFGLCIINCNNNNCYYTNTITECKIYIYLYLNLLICKKKKVEVVVLNDLARFIYGYS